jgi:hypothetical protein
MLGAIPHIDIPAVEQAELAEGIGDFNAARTWREIAVAAKLAFRR